MSRSKRPRIKNVNKPFIVINHKRYYEGEYDDMEYLEIKDNKGNIVWCSVYSKDNEQFDGHYNQKRYSTKHHRLYTENSREHISKLKRNYKRLFKDKSKLK